MSQQHPTLIVTIQNRAHHARIGAEASGCSSVGEAAEAILPSAKPQPSALACQRGIAAAGTLNPADHPRARLERLVGIQEVIVRTGMSRSTIYARLDPKHRSFDDTFPKQVYIRGSRLARFRESDLDAWIEARPYRTVGAAA